MGAVEIYRPKGAKMQTKEYKRKLKSLKAKVLELVLEDMGAITNKEDACALGWAVSLIETLTIYRDYSVGGGDFMEHTSNSQWVAERSVDRALKKLLGGSRYGKLK